MKCYFCDKEATVHLKQILNNETIELHLCEACAEERGITDPEGFSLADMLGDKPEQTNERFLKPILDCKKCGFKLEDFKKVGRLGCPDCYAVFQPEISGMLESMHKDITHVGNRPEGMFEKTQIKQEIASIKKQIKKAVDEENYESAALLRDKLKEMEAKI